MPRNVDTLVQQGDVYLDRETMLPYSGPVFEFAGFDTTRVVFRAVLRNGEYHGSFTDYSPEGTDEGYQEGEYRDGLKEGPYTNFYPSGIIQAEGSYRSGLQDGPYTRWYENGQLRSEWTYSSGIFNGPYEEFGENGQLLERGTVSNQWRCGEWIYESRPRTFDPCPSNEPTATVGTVATGDIETVAIGNIEVDPDPYVGIKLRSEAMVAGLLGAQGVWAATPSGNPVLISWSDELMSEGLNVSVGDMMALEGVVTELSEPTLDEWSTARTISEIDRMVAEFVSYFIAADRIDVLLQKCGEWIEEGELVTDDPCPSN